MDDSGFGSEFMSSPDDVLLDIESPIHDNQQSQLGNSPMVHEKYMNVSVGLDSDHQPIVLVSKGYSTNYSKGKAVCPVDNADGSSSDDDGEPSFMEDGIGENSNAAKNKQGSPWQRMTWTDNVIRLLIAVVACVGEDGTLDGGEGHKRKSGVLQKKGKWKLVSEIIINKGCHVSPQQCEDKFNDLNKKYKKLNEILGKGVSCKVVENPALMNSMPKLSSQEKDEVKKILSSKHLFYREMCAYHNGQKIPNCQDLDLQGCLPLEQCSKDDSQLEEVAEENDDSDNDDSDNEDDDNAHENEERMVTYPEREKVDEENACHRSQSDFCNNFYVEMAVMFQDPAVSSHERKEWIKRQKLLLTEQRVGIQAQAFEIEKQQFKWFGYRSRKNREFERLRLENVKMKLENEQSILQLRQKRMEMEVRSSEMSVEPASLGSDGIQGREHVDLEGHQ